MDLGNESRKALIDGQTVAMSNNAKRILALRVLGNNHILHPEYQQTPRHSNRDGWVNHSVLRGVADAARAAGRI